MSQTERGFSRLMYSNSWFVFKTAHVTFIIPKEYRIKSHIVSGANSLHPNASVVFHIKRAFRKPLKARVQGADRRECRLPFQGLQRGNRALSGFPQGGAACLEATSSLPRLNVRFI